MTWDKAKPDGNLSIALGDDDIRTNNDALEPALDFEHGFATGGVQTGRHKFSLDTKANIDVQSGPLTGSIAIATDPRPNGSLVHYTGTAWVYTDIGVGNVAYVDEVGDWTAMQNSTWLQVVPAASLIAVDASLSAAQYATISGNITISNPTNTVAGSAASIMLEITMGAGSLTISWGNNYHAANGAAPVFGDSNGDINVFLLSRLQAGTWLVTSVSDISVIV
jgi:hypothetical protein